MPSRGMEAEAEAEELKRRSARTGAWRAGRLTPCRQSRREEYPGSRRRVVGGGAGGGRGMMWKRRGPFRSSRKLGLSQLEEQSELASSLEDASAISASLEEGEGAS